MKLKFVTIFVCIELCFLSLSFAQVKIGNQPESIHAASLLELASEDKVLIISRVTTPQMQTISPLEGALVFNTDEKAIYYFDGIDWKELGGMHQNLHFDPINHVLSLDNGSTVDLSSLLGGGLSQEVVLDHIATNGQIVFPTPLPIIDPSKVNVYRNGIRLNFSVHTFNSIQLESGVVCFENDLVKIVQFQ
ncbi:MAG: hypothetical protein OIF50_08045 [Flavobacteriaceae bacterium]|nr:hypothetical protein [Flavobacteriaceae bacterium]